MIMKNLLLFMPLACVFSSVSPFFGPRYDVVIQSQRRQKDLCYYSFNILRAREQLMAAEKYETLFLFSFRLQFSYRLRCIIYEIERIECRMRIAYNETLKYPLDKPLTGWRNFMFVDLPLL
jgi:hypothetical protein